MDTDADFRTPGQLIEKLLAERDWEQKFLAYWLGVSETIVSRMVAGSRPVNAEMALALGEIFGIEPERFLRLQQAYDLGKARLVTPEDPSRAIRANLFGNLPVTAMIKRGWLNVDSIKDVSGVERELKKFFGVKNLDEIETVPHAARKTMVAGVANEKLRADAQLVWIYRVKKIAAEMMNQLKSKKGN